MKIKIIDVIQMLIIYEKDERSIICDLTYGIDFLSIYKRAITALGYNIDYITDDNDDDLLNIIENMCEDCYYNNKFKIVPEDITFEI